MLCLAMNRFLYQSRMRKNRAVNIILTLNVGSSSVKCALFEIHGGTPMLWATLSLDKRAGQVFYTLEGHGHAVQRSGKCEFISSHAMLTYVHEILSQNLPPYEMVAVGHRVVHGGDVYVSSTRIDDAMLDVLETLIPLAPLHLPSELDAIQIFKLLYPNAQHIACFDTAFHSRHSDVSRMFGLPRSYFEAGIKRYGFHGLSYDYIAGELLNIDPQVAKGRVIVAHLGSGASLCAMKDGVSVATTMGFTALDGLVMATRSGSVDVGAILYLQRLKDLSVDALEHVLYYESGLKGISGISGDMRELEASSALEAKQAIEVFCYHIIREMGGLVAVLGGLDALVFTAGIGEHSAYVRSKVLHALMWLGAACDEGKNQVDAQLISSESSRVKAFVIPTNEEVMIARQVMKNLV